MLRNLLSICLITASITACAQDKAQSAQLQPTKESVSIGENISPDGAIDVSTLAKNMEGKTEMEATVKGKVVEVCKKKGCWMTLENKDGGTMRVTFKDYAFFMPKDIHGRDVIISGIASVETTEVDVLQHYAEDGGQSKEEIAKITEPKKELNFEAKGVLLY